MSSDEEPGLAHFIHQELPEVPEIKHDLPRIESHAEQAVEIRRWGLAYSLPTALAAPVIILVIAGYKADEWLHSSPWFTLSGALIGSAVGLTNMVRIANRLNR